MSEDRRRTVCSNGYAHWRRYLDEDAWETMGADTVRWALSDVYHDVALALDFLHEAGRIRTPASTYEAVPV